MSETTLREFTFIQAIGSDSQELFRSLLDALGRMQNDFHGPEGL